MTQRETDKSFESHGDGLAPGAHVCLFLTDEDQRRSVVVPFLKAGLDSGQKTLYLADDPEAATAWLQAEGLPVSEDRRAEAVQLQRAESAYCPDGRFNPERMLKELARLAHEACRHGCQSLRITGEMGWAARGAPGSERLEEYEAKVDNVLRELGVTAMCQYDTGQWQGDALYRLFKLHRYLVVGGRLIEIPQPDGYGGEGADPAILGRLLAALLVMESLSDSERAVQFVEAMVQDIPGVAVGTLRLLAEPAATCQAAVWEPFTSREPSEARSLSLRVSTATADFGELELELRDHAAVKPYRSFLANLVTTLGFLRENRWQRGQALDALAESEEQCRAIFQTMRDGCGLSRMIYDDQGRPVDWLYVRVNPAFERILGRSGLEGRRASEVFPGMPEPLPRLLEVYGRVARTGESERLELEMPTLGKWMDISVSCPYADHFMAVYTDATERHHLEEHLRQVEKMEAVGQLAGGVAHDFNNLLTAILGYSELLADHQAVLTAGLQEDVLEIKRAAERGATLTRQLLAFSRRQDMRPQLLSLNDVLSGLAPLLRRSLGEHIELVTREEPALALAEVDPHQIERVIMNLALNARDAMPQGGTLLIETANVELDAAYCRTRRDSSPGAYVRLSVSDTGHGMERAVLERIFEPFFTTKRPGEGTGLGLSTVYGIVRQSGGHVEVESHPGKGTTFRVYLPRAAHAAEPSLASEAAPGESVGGGGGETILVVEDETAVRTLAQRILCSAGYRVLTFSDPADALAVLGRQEVSVDLLLTDVVLPGPLQGDDLARAALALRPGLPVVFMSGYTQNALSREGRLGSGAGYVEKPFTSESLLAQVKGRLRTS
jgi:nitrogen-specific signal transduction histidine kinase/CheY-like chemotaxis protein